MFHDLKTWCTAKMQGSGNKVTTAAAVLAQSVKCVTAEWEVVGSIPGARLITGVLK